MPSRSNRPTSFRSLLAPFRSLVSAPSATTVCALVAGFLAHTGERNISGKLARLAQLWHHGRAHRLFATAPWSIDALGLLLADFIITAVVPPMPPVAWWSTTP